MPVLWLNSIAGLLITLAGTLIGKILLALGVGAVTYSGITLTINALQTFIFGQAGGIAGPAGQVFGLLHVLDAGEMIVSAVVVRYTLNGLSAGGSIYKWKMGQPS